MFSVSFESTLSSLHLSQRTRVWEIGGKWNQLFQISSGPMAVCLNLRLASTSHNSSLQYSTCIREESFIGTSRCEIFHGRIRYGYISLILLVELWGPKQESWNQTGRYNHDNIFRRRTFCLTSSVILKWPISDSQTSSGVISWCRRIVAHPSMRLPRYSRSIATMDPL